jgi:hypothetical protein
LGIAKEPNWDRTASIQRIIRHISKLVTEEHNVSMCKPIEKEEVNQVVQEMLIGKAPCPNGFTEEFFKAYWDVVKNEIYDVVEVPETQPPSRRN